MCLSCCCCICVFEQWRHCFTNLRLLSGAPSLVEVRQLFLLQYFADFPHTRVNMFALQNSTNTTKNFQNTNYPFTSHSIGERSPKVSIWRVKHIKHHHCDFVKTTNQVNKWYLWIQNLGFLAWPTLMHCFREKKSRAGAVFPHFCGEIVTEDRLVLCPAPVPHQWTVSSGSSLSLLHHSSSSSPSLYSHYHFFPPPHHPHHIYHYTKIILPAGMINWCILFLECIIPTTLHTLELRHKLVFRFLWRPNKTRGLTPWYTIANKLPTKGIYGERAGHTWKFGRFLLQLTMS